MKQLHCDPKGSPVGRQYYGTNDILYILYGPSNIGVEQIEQFHFV